MKFAIKSLAIIAAAALTLSLAGAALANGPEPVLGFAGIENVTPNGVGKSDAGPGINVTAVVYDNTTSPANFGVSSIDLAAQWGDRLLTTGTGVLNAQSLTLFNSGSSAGPVLTAVLGVSFFDGVTSLSLGGYTVNVNFGAGLAAGFYSIVSVGSLDALAINLNVTDVIVVQTVVSFTGGATRMGIASLNPPTVGSSPTSMYIAASTIGGGVPGFYTFTAGPANPGYKVTVTVPTVGVEATTWSTLKDLYR